ncbi:MAG TPA: hypothetical protein HPQ00_15420, partial [Magnetococcales bacterium]|nr:hypothetical protein [Magnetococcales bacterium]
PFFDAAKVLAHAISWRTIPVATQGDAMIVGFIKELLHNGCDRKNYRVLASREFCQDIPGYSVILEKCFGPKGALVLTRLFQQEPDRGEPLESVARHVRRLHKQQHRRISPGQYFKRRIHHALHRGRRLFFPPGYCLAMLGTDGSGKSAMIESIEQALGSALHGAIKTRHWRPGLLPSIVVLLGGKGPDGPVTNPHQAPGSGKIGSLLRLGYYALDFLLGYWLIVFPQLVRQPCLCIFDRYFYDFYMDPLRSRVNLPPWIVRLFDGFIPKPDLVICLGAEPEVIFARKPELSLKEITLQMDRLRRWQQTFSRSFWVDSGQSMEQTRDEVTTLLFRAMARKMERHYGIFPE